MLHGEMNEFLEELNDYTSRMNTVPYSDTSKACKNWLMDINQKDLTANMFSNMSDHEMINYFIPVRGIDYDQNPVEVEDSLKKPTELGEIQESKDMLHQISEWNPLMKYESALKEAFYSIENNDVTKDNIKNEIKSNNDVENEPVQVQAKEPIPDNDSPSPTRIVKRRKPRTYKYNPKPLLHKESRSFVPDGLKDTEYWERRKRNNAAAKKSREERRKKELEILSTYDTMKQEYTDMKVENIRLKSYIEILEEQLKELEKKVIILTEDTKI